MQAFQSVGFGIAGAVMFSKNSQKLVGIMILIVWVFKHFLFVDNWLMITSLEWVWLQRLNGVGVGNAVPWKNVHVP